MSDIQVISQKLVTLYDDELLAVQADDHHVYVSINHLCDALGIAPHAQRRRIREHDVLGEGFTMANVLTQGGNQQAAMLRADLVPLWLIGIQIKSVREDIQPKLKLFIRRAAEILNDAFQEGQLTADNFFDELLESSDSEAVEAYRMLQAMVKLARNQILIESRLTEQDSRLTDYETRLEAVETVLGDTGRSVTPDQAMQVSQAVRTVALELGKRSKKNEYGAVYGQLYRHFGVTSYKQLPASQFEQAMTWLTNWYKRITGATSPDEVPF